MDVSPDVGPRGCGGWAAFWSPRCPHPMASCEYVIAATEKANPGFRAASGVLEGIPKNAHVALEPGRGQRLEESEDDNRRSPGRCYQRRGCEGFW